MIKRNQDSSDEITDVSQGFVFPISQNPDHQFSSIDEIPQEMRDEGRALIEEVADYTKFFFKDDVYTIITENNIISFSEGGGGGYGEEPRWFRLFDQDGKQIASCIDGCPTYDTLSLGQENPRVAFHELLHDAWFTYLNEQEKVQLSDNLKLFFNAVGANWQTEELIGAIWTSVKHSNPNSLNETQTLSFENHLQGLELDDWANETLSDSGLSESQINYLKQTIKAYFEIRSSITFTRTYGFSEQDRDNFVVIEGFAYLGANADVLDEIYTGSGFQNQRVIPAFMRSGYATIIKDEELTKMIYSGFGHFYSTDNFNNFIPHLESFVNWMKNKYPELQNIGQ